MGGGGGEGGEGRQKVLKGAHNVFGGVLKLDNTGAWVIEVNPSLLCDWMS